MLEPIQAGFATRVLLMTGLSLLYKRSADTSGISRAATRGATNMLSILCCGLLSADNQL